MNNIFLNNDPLLYRTSSTTPMSYQDMQTPQQMNDMYSQMYRLLFMNLDIPPQYEDHIGNFDRELQELDKEVVESLSTNEEYGNLSKLLLADIQRELISLIRNRINMNPNVIKNINKQREIIKSCQLSIKTSERLNIQELNDYMKNYSHLSFDEYKKIKNETE